MADTFTLSATASCAAGAGVLDCAGQFTLGSNPHEDSANFTCYLFLAGTEVDARPLAKNGTCQFTGVGDGSYTLAWRGDESGNTVATGAVGVDCAGAGVLVLNPLGHTNETVVRDNGTITASATGGIDPLAITVLGIGQTQFTTAGVAVTFTALPPGTYAVRVTDVGGQQATASVTIAAYALPVVSGCTDPAANNYNPAAALDDGSCTYTPAVRVPYFAVPRLQSLRFVLPNRPDLPAFDNRLLADSAPSGVNNPGYAQLVERADTLVLQYQHNYTGTVSVELRPVGSGTAIAFAPTRIVQGAGRTADFAAYARLDVSSGNTRIYFNSEALPLPLLPAARITLTGAGALDGTYSVSNVLEDAAAGVPYLLLAVPYPGAAQRIDLSLSTPYALQAFDTWQVALPFAAVPGGCYQCVITATDADFDTAVAVSEPLEVRTTHPDTLLIAWRNFDNAFGLNYTAGQVNRVRVRGTFFGTESPSQKTSLRGSDNRLTLLSAEMQRKIPLTVQLAPFYLHETIAAACAQDYLRVNGVEVVSEDEYKYPATPRYTLGTGSILLEQVDFLTGNRDDVGDVDTGGPYLFAAAGRYLNANPI